MDALIYAAGVLTGAALTSGSLYVGHKFGWDARDALGVIAGESHVQVTPPEAVPGRSFDEFGVEEEDETPDE